MKGMEKIELVIKIQKAYYELVLERCKEPILLNAFKNGTVLPEGHGDLIDTNDIRVIELEDSLHVIRHEKGDEVGVYIDAPTIIEANKTENEEEEEEDV